MTAKPRWLANTEANLAEKEDQEVKRQRLVCTSSAASLLLQVCSVQLSLSVVKPQASVWPSFSLSASSGGSVSS